MLYVFQILVFFLNIWVILVYIQILCSFIVLQYIFVISIYSALIVNTVTKNVRKVSIFCWSRKCYKQALIYFC